MSVIFSSPPLTFLAQHAVAEDELGEQCVFLQCLAQNGAGLHGQTLAPQIQFGASGCSSDLLELSQDRLLGLHACFLTQPLVGLSEILHRWTETSVNVPASCTFTPRLYATEKHKYRFGKMGYLMVLIHYYSTRSLGFDGTGVMDL